MRIFSCGIFGTIVTARTATQSGIFAVMGHLLAGRHRDLLPEKILSEGFFRIRVAAENGNPNSLGEIYRRIGKLWRLDDTSVSRLVSIEEDLVYDFSIPIARHMEKIKSLAEHERLVFVSDTYYSRKLVERILEKAGISQGSCGLYLRSETGLSKDSGDLFRHMLTSENANAKEVEHYGANRIADLKIPASLGIRANLSDECGLERSELIYLDESDPYRQLYAGTSRMCRRNNPYNKNSYYDIGAGLGGPILFGLVESTIENAMADGFGRLYFLARDGQIMMKIAEIINNKRKLGLELRYLYVARQTSHFSAIFDLCERDIRIATIDFGRLTKNMLAWRLNLTYEELDSYVSNFEGRRTPEGKDEKLPEKSIEIIRNCLRSCEPLRRRIIDIAAEKRKSMLRYLEQEGVFDSSRVAVVDIGWTGEMQDSLYRIISSRNPDIELFGYYYGITGISPDTSEFNVKRSYAINPGQTSDFSFVTALELLTKAPHGTTFDYRESENGRMEPCTRPHANDAQIEAVQQGILDFSSNFEDIQSRFPELRGAHAVFAVKLLDLLYRPDYKTASVLGGMLHSSDQNDAEPRETAPVFSVPGALYYALCANSTRKKEITIWKEASLARSGKLPRYIVEYLDAAAILRKIKKAAGNFLNRYN